MKDKFKDLSKITNPMKNKRKIFGLRSHTLSKAMVIFP